ncbi:MAG TPA: GrpB family protein [Pseudonocardiaceae bacterium]|jgi:GrpB-like predicted nucleotidyltransferase (UPF0157 family)|nr:GrpB family protein [Pseudonocardiaceae bacterium]
MTSDEQLAAVTIGPRPTYVPIVLADYDPEWPRLYEREEARIRAILGDRIVRIDHVGSTSVPGLAAKPIIDMMLVLPDTTDEPSYLPDLAAAGYVLRIREPDWYEHRLFKGPDTDINLHVHPPTSPEIRRHLIFRDWLRTNESDRERYLATKRELAERRWKYVQNYADAKSEVIEEIIGRAEQAAC